MTNRRGAILFGACSVISFLVYSHMTSNITKAEAYETRSQQGGSVTLMALGNERSTMVFPNGASIPIRWRFRTGNDGLPTRDCLGDSDSCYATDDLGREWLVSDPPGFNWDIAVHGLFFLLGCFSGFLALVYLYHASGEKAGTPS